jgi:ABC-type phosphate transport system substrate-binding protein
MVHRAFIFVLALIGLAAFSTSRAHGEEALAVIVNRSNPVENVTLEELRKYCVAERKHWSDNTRVTVVLHDPGQAVRASVLQIVYRMSENDFSRYFIQGEFTGEIQSAPKHLATGSGVRRFVFNVPGAIGFIRAAEADSSVKIIRVNGLAPGDPQYPLRLVSQ